MFSMILLSMKTLLEPNDIRILPQHRLKVAKTNLILAVFYYNGTFAAIHASHISVLEGGKRYIDNPRTHELLTVHVYPSHSG